MRNYENLSADMLLSPRSHSFFWEWRSVHGQGSAARLLLALWQKEESCCSAEPIERLVLWHDAPHAALAGAYGARLHAAHTRMDPSKR